MQSDSESSGEEPDFGEDDEEIDEDLAFTKEDQAKYGHWFDDEGEAEDSSDDEGGSGRASDGGGSSGGDFAEADEWLQASDGSEAGARISPGGKRP